MKKKELVGAALATRVGKRGGCVLAAQSVNGKLGAVGSELLMGTGIDREAAPDVTASNATTVIPTITVSYATTDHATELAANQYAYKTVWSTIRTTVHATFQTTYTTTVITSMVFPDSYITFFSCLIFHD